MTDVERWGLLELQVDGPVAMEFHHEDDSAYVESFRDGDQWLIRFMPSLEGTWRYTGAVSGVFTCTPATTRGPVRRSGTTLRSADGTPYHPLTTTWFGTPDNWPEACRALAASPFNRVRLCASADSVDAQVRDLSAVDMVAEIVVDSFVPEVVSRLAAYRNITWCIENTADVRAVAEQIAEYDSGRHLISAHAAADPGVPWLTHLSVSLENLRGVSALRRDYDKPVHVDACGYEGNGSTPDTSLTAQEMLTRIWEGTVRGAYVTHGEWYVDHASGPWSDGGVRPTGVAAQRLRLLREVLDELPDGVEPIDDYRDAPTLAVPGSYYLQYLGEHQFPDRTFSLPAGTYQVEVLDVWNHSVRRTVENVEESLTVRLPGTQYQAIQIRRTA
ncbi:DUF5605 domain-containing protein [Kribbella sp. NPDC050470]|uniref:DUF5605 domain-containing protein n=1 Tax=unclassified Kribbella TaxID=2644121 RepID=UPI0037B521F3